MPSHAAPTRDIVQLVELNRAKIFEIAGFIMEWSTVPSTPEDLLARLAGHYGIELNPAQYVLVGSTLRSYLAWLLDRKELTGRFEDGRMMVERS